MYVGFDYNGGANWQAVSDWRELPWDTYYSRTDPGSFSSGYFQVPGGPSLCAVADTIGSLHRHFGVAGFSVLEYCDRADGDRSRLVTALRGAQARSCCG